MTAAEPWEELISVERVLWCHQEGIRRYHGQGDVTEKAQDCVRGILGNAWSAALYREPEEATQGLCFTCCLLTYLTKGHCFIDGNKRVGWLAATEILAGFRLTIVATEDEAYDLVLKIVEEDLDPDFVVDWVAERLDWLH